MYRTIQKILPITLVWVVGCASHSGYVAPTVGQKKVVSETGAVAPGHTTKNRLAIYTINYTFYTSENEKINEALADLVKTHNGFIVRQTNTYTTFRVPAGTGDLVQREVEKLAQVKDKEITGEDVTDQHEDLTLQIESLRKARERYLELLAKAENVEAALKVEKELERTNRELDLLEGHLKRLNHLVAYVTFVVSLEQKQRPGPLGWIFVGIYSGVKWLFVW